MRALGKSVAAVVAGIGLLLTAQGRADARPAYAKAEKKPCTFCHVGKTSDKVFTDAGKFYSMNLTLKGFGEEAEAPEKAAPESAAAPEKKTEAPPAAMAATEIPCPCGCPHRHKMEGMHPMGEMRKGHLDECRKIVADLRESEKRMESLTDPQAFRAAVLEHLKKLDDLEESRLDHMEAMMGAWHGGMKGPPRRRCP